MLLILNLPPVFYPSQSATNPEVPHKILSDLIFTDYVAHLRQQFSWLKPFLPDERLDHYIQLLAFKNSTNLPSKIPAHLQFKDLYTLLALWDFELNLGNKKIPQSVIKAIDNKMCAQAPDLYRMGMVTRLDIVLQQQQIVRQLRLTSSQSHTADISCVNDLLPQLMSITVLPT